MKREHLTATAAAVILIAAAWILTTRDLRAKAKAQLEVSAGAADDSPVSVSVGQAPVSHGVTPARYPVHFPRYAHLGRHRMYRHPRTCSPGTGAPSAVAYAWLYSPPSEGDL